MYVVIMYIYLNMLDQACVEVYRNVCLYMYYLHMYIDMCVYIYYMYIDV